MNREIEFRMWNCVKDNPSASKYFYDVNNVMECLKQQMLFNRGNKVLGYDHIGDGCAFEQYTGLKDRNGVKIFEGDVIKMHNRYAKVWEGAFVVYHRPMFVIEKPFNDGVCEDFTYEEWERDFEVCGNIHTP